MDLCNQYIGQNENFSSYDDFYNNLKIKIPENFNFAYDVVDKYAQVAPERTALIWCNDDSEEKIFSFSELSQLSSQTANYLISKGIKKGDSVMLALHRRYEYWFFILALHKIGAIAVPVTDQLMEKDFEFRINAADIKMIVLGHNERAAIQIENAKQSIIKKTEIPEKNKSAVNNHVKSDILLVGVNFSREGWVDYQTEISNYSTNFTRPKDVTKNDDVMLVYFTSGTSGNPKMVAHNYVYPLSHIITAKYWQNVEKDGIHYSVAETGWAKASWGKIYGQWFSGAAVFVYDRRGFNPDNMLAKIEKYHVSSFCAPPTIYRYLIRSDFSKYDLSSLKHCCTAGESLNTEVYKRFYEKTGLKIFEGYGQSETSILIANFSFMEIKPGSIGKPNPCFNIKIVDSLGKECKPGKNGEIIIDCKNVISEKMLIPGLFAGYYKDVKQTKRVFKNKIYHTGDIAYKDENGYFWFVGRKDDIIKSSGFRISPFEVESVLMQHPAVEECAVTGEDDFFRGKSIKATVVLKEGYEPSKTLEQQIIDFVKHQTALYKCPRKIVFEKELPKSYNEKIKRSSISKNK